MPALRRRNILQVFAWFGLSFGGGTAMTVAASCYDANSPNLPECDPKNPDNSAGCFDRRAKDAGKDGPDAS